MAKKLVSPKGGEGLLNKDTSIGMTAGAFGTCNGKTVLITCGHGNNENTTIEYNNYDIGKISYQRANTEPLPEDGSDDEKYYGDFSIISLNDNVTSTNTLCNGTKITGTYSYMPEGAQIYKYGKSTGFSSGTVMRASGVERYGPGGREEYIVKGLYKCSMVHGPEHADAVANGDSGGPVYCTSGSENYLCGIVTACNSGALDGQPGPVMLYTPIIDILFYEDFKLITE